MAPWRTIIQRLGNDADEYFEQLKSRFQQRLQLRSPRQLLLYRGYGTTTSLQLMGRVLANPNPTPASASDTVWENLVASYQRFGTRELPGVHVDAQFGDVLQSNITDDEGYFAFSLPLPAADTIQPGWQTVTVTVQNQTADAPPLLQGSGQVLVPAANSEFGVISDIDDTIVQSYATNVLKMARLVFLGNAHTRLPFAGVAAFYRALQAGAQGAANNPIFYVSSSPWNMYDLLAEFMDLHMLPRGPLFLRDYDIERKRLLNFRHHDHKLERIRQLLTTYPDLPFILIGDSGQEDPELYRQAVKEFPGRIRAIYIRDVSSDRRDAEVRALAEAARAESVDLLSVPDTLSAAHHAAAQGWIAQETLMEIGEEKRKDEEAPTELEQLLEGN